MNEAALRNVYKILSGKGNLKGRYQEVFSDVTVIAATLYLISRAITSVLLMPQEELDAFDTLSFGSSVAILLLCIALWLRFGFQWLTARQLSLIVLTIILGLNFLLFWYRGPTPVFILTFVICTIMMNTWIKKLSRVMALIGLHSSVICMFAWIQYKSPGMHPSESLTDAFSTWPVFLAGYLPILAILGLASAISCRLRDGFVRQRLAVENYLKSIAIMKQQGLIALLARGVVHDINNLAAPLAANHYFLQQNLAQCPGEHAEDLAMLEENMETIIKQRSVLRMLMKYSSKEGVTQFVHFEPEETVRGCLKVLRSQLPSDADLQLVCKGELPQVRFNALMMFQILANLVKNAADAQVPGRPLRVVIELADNAGLDVTVSDNGCGIPAALLDGIFDINFTTKGENGFGTGLATVKAMLQLAGGELNVTSVEGEGSSFRIHLPPLELQTDVDSSRG